MRNLLILVLLAAFGLMLYPIISEFSPNEGLSKVSEYYATPANVATINAANLVTAVVVTYRGLDTLGEVTILFLSAAIISFFIKAKESKRKLRANSEILITASRLLLPIIIMLGVYIFINGHLTPGGGFQGGSVIASAVILLILAFPEKPVNRKFLDFLESLSGSVYVAIAAMGAVVGLGFLDTTILPKGSFGHLVSAGAIPIIYSFIGLKVGAELSNILSQFRSVQSE